jgi:hypothetical protein
VEPDVLRRWVVELQAASGAARGLARACWDAELMIKLDPDPAPHRALFEALDALARAMNRVDAFEREVGIARVQKRPGRA